MRGRCPRVWHPVANAGIGPLPFYLVAAPPVEDDAEIAG